MLGTLAVEGYRSLRALVLPVGRLTVVCGANGAGKSSLYRSLRLLAGAADGHLVGSLAAEGGLASALWAGPRSTESRRSPPMALRLGFSDDPFSYAVDVGIPGDGEAPFRYVPVIKRECIWSGAVLRPASVLVDRSGPLVRLRTGGGRWEELSRSVPGHESLLIGLGDPQRAPEVFDLRRHVSQWRFYDHLRTDPEAPARRPCVATTTMVLAPDGSDLAAAVETIRWQGDHRLDDAVADAFDGAAVDATERNGWAEIAFREPGVQRPLAARELSEGTLRFLLLATALLSPRPPRLLVLNEPETSLHPNLIRPLADLIAQAADDTQVIVVSHAESLVGALADAGATVCRLTKDGGETTVEGQGGLLDRPFWKWPKR